jgi:prepilin-type N-terminal cleavage/methylation domain-containing protein
LGFTLIEMMVAVSVVGLLAGLAVSKWSAFQRSKALDAEANAFTAVLADARSRVMKKDMPHLIALDADGSGYALYEDRDADKVADPDERISGHRLPSTVNFGAPSLGGQKGPGGAGSPASSTEGGWAANLYLDADRLATLNEGSLYLSAPGLKNRAVCIRKAAGARQAQVWRWDGSRWTAM